MNGEQSMTRSPVPVADHERMETNREQTNDMYTTDPYGADEAKSLGTLFNELTADFSYLVRKEIELARAETTEKISKATRSIVLMVAAGLLAYAGFIVLLIAAADLLYAAIGVYWIASLIVGVVVLLIAAGLFFAGRSRLSALNVMPEKTIETLKEDARWAKEQI